VDMVMDVLRALASPNVDVSRKVLDLSMIRMIRLFLCVRLLCTTGDDVRKVWLQSCRQSFVNICLLRSNLRRLRR